MKAAAKREFREAYNAIERNQPQKAYKILTEFTAKNPAFDAMGLLGEVVNRPDTLQAMGQDSSPVRSSQENSMTEVVDTPVGFADATLESYSRSAKNIVSVRVRAWNGKRVCVHFLDVLGLKDLLTGDISSLVSTNSSSDALLMEALGRNYESIPQPHPYALYTFLNNDEKPALSVVASECRIELE